MTEFSTKATRKDIFLKSLVCKLYATNNFALVLKYFLRKDNDKRKENRKKEEARREKREQ